MSDDAAKPGPFSIRSDVAIGVGPIVTAWGRLREISPPAHPVHVRIVDYPCISDDNESYGFGCFQVYDGVATFLIAGQNPAPAEMDDADFERTVRETFLQAYARYEQYRDGRPGRRAEADARAVELAGLIDAARRAPWRGLGVAGRAGEAARRSLKLHPGDPDTAA